MDHAFELTGPNRLLLAVAFKNHQRVDISIDCVTEGSMGQAFVDDPDCPAAFRITTGPFWYLAGAARSPGAYHMAQGFPPYHLLMPSPPEWVEALRELHPDLRSMPRYRFSAARLSPERLERLLQDSPHRDCLAPLDAARASRLAAAPERILEIGDFDSAEDFARRGIGYAALAGDEVMGLAYSSLVYSRGIEVSIYVEAPYRRRGVATALGSRLVLESLRRGLRPNWDAANPESCKLALKLGYVFVEDYEAYYYVEEQGE